MLLYNIASYRWLAMYFKVFNLHWDQWMMDNNNLHKLALKLHCGYIHMASSNKVLYKLLNRENNLRQTNGA